MILQLPDWLRSQDMVHVTILQRLFRFPFFFNPESGFVLRRFLRLHYLGYLPCICLNSPLVDRIPSSQQTRPNPKGWI